MVPFEKLLPHLENILKFTILKNNILHYPSSLFVDLKEENANLKLVDLKIITLIHQSNLNSTVSIVLLPKRPNLNLLINQSSSRSIVLLLAIHYKTEKFIIQIILQDHWFSFFSKVSIVREQSRAVCWVGRKEVEGPETEAQTPATLTRVRMPVCGDRLSSESEATEEFQARDNIV